MKKILVIFLFLWSIGFGEVKTISFTPYNLTYDEQAEQIRRINLMLRHGWVLIDITQSFRTTTFVLEYKK